MNETKPSYSVDTLERLRRDQPDDEFFLVIGADSFVQLPKWRSWRRILELVEPAVMVRPGWSLDENFETLANEQRWAVESDRVHFVENPPVDLASSDIRRRLRSGEALPQNALHPRVLRYAEKYGLYRQSST